MSNGSLIAYRKRVLMYSKWIGSRLRNWDPDFTYENNKEVIDTVYWLRKAVNREWTRRNNAAYEAHKKAIAKSGDWRKRFPRRWYKSEYAEAYKND